MNTGGIIAIVVIIVLIVGSIFLLGRDGTDNEITNGDETTEQDGDGASTNAIVATTQESGSEVTVTSVLLDEGGYVVVHRFVDGAPGAVIGNSNLLPDGSSQNIVVKLSENIVGGEELILMLHTDDGNGTYEFPGPDAPTKDSTDEIVLTKVVVGAKAGEDVVKEESAMEEEVMEDTSTEDEEETSPPPPPPPPAEPTSTTVDVTYTGDGFSPSSVSISTGDTVRFTNDSGRSMWIASAIHPTHTLYPEKTENDCLGSAFDACEGTSVGESYSFIFNEEGSWGYHDHFSAGRRGTVVVE